MAVLGSFFPYPLPTLTPMLLISDPRTGRSDDDDSDLVFDSFTLSAILKENKNIGKSTSLPHIKFGPCLHNRYHINYSNSAKHFKTIHWFNLAAINLKRGFFSTSAHLGLDNLGPGDHSAHCRLLCSISRLQPQDARSTQVVTIRSVS